MSPITKSVMSTSISAHTPSSYSSYLNSQQTTLEVKSKYDAEFRRFGLVRCQLSKFEEFYQLLERLHGLYGIQFNIYYTDKDGDLLPINNDNNFNRVQHVTAGILRLIILRKGECYPDHHGGGGGGVAAHHSLNASGASFASVAGGSSASYRATNIFSQIKELSNPFGHHGANSGARPLLISLPEDFRPVSAIIDVDILPESHRRVRLHKHKSSKPLGFYIRDGRSLRVTPNGVEQVPGIFISRLMPGGLAESTGLLSVNDEVIEVNGIEVAGKTLDQVTDMMVANSSNLIITVKPTNQKHNLNKSSLNSTGSNNTSLSSTNTNLNLKQMYMANNMLTNRSNFMSTSLVKNSTAIKPEAPKLNSTANMSSSSVNSSFSSNHHHHSNNKKSDTASFKSGLTSYQKAQVPVLQSAQQSGDSRTTSEVNGIFNGNGNKNNKSTNVASNNEVVAKRDGSDVDNNYCLDEDSEDEDDDDDEEIHDATGHNNTDNDEEKILTL